MLMKNPPHPGKHVRVNCIEALDLSVKEAARQLGIPRNRLSNLVNEKAGISLEMAIRFERMGWGTADGWLRLQLNYDRAQVLARKDEITINLPLIERVSDSASKISDSASKTNDSASKLNDSASKTAAA